MIVPANKTPVPHSGRRGAAKHLGFWIAEFEFAAALRTVYAGNFTIW